MNKWHKLIIAGAVVLGALIYLMATGVKSHGVYYAEVSEIGADPVKFSQKGSRVSGTVVAGTIDETAERLVFGMKDSAKDDVIVVEFKGFVPDAFKEDVTVIVEGKYDMTSKTFHAKNLLAKCPSRYEGMDPEEHDKAIAENNAKL